jgi:hypothetical protein
VFHEHDAGPEQINEAVLAGNSLYRFFKRRHDATADTKDVEKLIPESLFFSLFALDALPLFRKSNCEMSDFVPRERHGWILAKMRCALGCEIPEPFQSVTNCHAEMNWTWAGKRMNGTSTAQALRRLRKDRPDLLSVKLLNLALSFTMPAMRGGAAAP